MAKAKTKATKEVSGTTEVVPTKEAPAKTVVVSTKNFDNIKSIISVMNKKAGKPLLKTGDDIPRIFKVPFREPALDYVTDGGVAIGRFYEALGKEHTGKTRNALKALAQFQKYCFNCHTDEALDVVWAQDSPNDMPYVSSCSCKNCDNPEPKLGAFIDIEGTTDPKFMEYLGVNPLGVVYSRIDMPSMAIDIVDALLRETNIGLIVVDSVGSMGSDSEVEKSMGDIKMNQNAMFLNRGMRKWQMALNANTNETGKENGATLMIINQSYQTLDLFSKEVAQGGRGLRHGKAQSIKNAIGELNKDPKTHEIKGVHVRISNEKNKTGMPYRRFEYYLNLDEFNPDIPYCGTNVNMQYVDLAINLGLLEQRGGWFYFEDKKWQGKSNIVDELPEEVKQAVDNYLYNN